MARTSEKCGIHSLFTVLYSYKVEVLKNSPIFEKFQNWNVNADGKCEYDMDANGTI